MKRVRIGNGCGFWGDNLDAPIALAEHGQLDYLTLEYLAELTMSILAIQKQRDPGSGYAGDFLDVLKRLGTTLVAKPAMRIVTNAGGMNPLACARRAREILDATGNANRKIGIVSGDDLMPRLDELLQAGHQLCNLDTGEPLHPVRDRVVSVNAYLGSRPIVEALVRNASIVITGRVADACLTVGPAIFEHGWKLDDINRVAAATVAGHLIECGAQVTGGLSCRWETVPNLADVGYPIADIAADGTFRIEKPPGTGGIINRETIAEQLLYEVGDPRRYLTPDVIADFTTVSVRQVARDVAEVAGSRGNPASDSYKVSIAYRDGFTSSGMLAIPGPDAARKARFAGNMLLQRLERIGICFAHSHVETIGAGELVPGLTPAYDPPEVMMRVAVRDTSKQAVERFTKEFAPLVTSGPPGVTGYTTGRPAVREVFAYWPALIDKSAVHETVEIL